jgi:hypothetical protein
MTRPPARPADPLWQRSENPDLEQRLGLYQVFSRLYEQHRPLLNEILDLENLHHPNGNQVLPRYVVAIAQGNQAHLLTNLLAGVSQMLYQAEQVWVIGRAPDATICLDDPRLSRYHAVIQYQRGQGFWLRDLDSTNGSFVNGEASCSPQRLQEGDRLRLGSTTIQFFEPSEARRLPGIPAQVRTQLGNALTPSLFVEEPTVATSEETLVFLQEDQDDTVDLAQQRREAQQAKLLERLHRQA